MSGAGTRTRGGEQARATSSRSRAAAPPGRTRPAPDPVRRRDPRRRRRWLWVLAGLVVVVGLAVAVAASPVLDVESVTVRGVAAERSGAVVDAAGIDVGDPILAFWPGRAASRVEELPWVERAAVVRDLPGSVRIDVVPRIPVGWTTAGRRILVVDAEGTVIEQTDAAPSGVPELTGVGDVAPVGGRIRPRSLAAAAGALGPELRMRLASVGLADAAITAQVVFGPQVRFGAPDRMATKARVAAAVLASLGDAPVGYVDVSVPAAPVTG